MNCFTNKLWIPPMLLFYNQFACVTGFVLTCMFCVQNTIISKCSYCLHNLICSSVKQEKHFMEWSKETIALLTAEVSPSAVMATSLYCMCMYCLSLAQEVPQWAGWIMRLNSQCCAFGTGFAFHHTDSQKRVTG